MSELPKFVYRMGYRVKDLALNKKRDFLTGLSLFDEPTGNESLKLSVKTLVANGFIVRPDAGKIATDIFDDTVYNEPNYVESITFPENHVTVWYPDKKYWQEWYENDLANRGTEKISEQLAFLALAIVRDEK
jgi:hypothetical protein